MFRNRAPFLFLFVLSASLSAAAAEAPMPPLLSPSPIAIESPPTAIASPLAALVSPFAAAVSALPAAVSPSGFTVGITSTSLVDLQEIMGRLVRENAFSFSRPRGTTEDVYRQVLNEGPTYEIRVERSLPPKYVRVLSGGRELVKLNLVVPLHISKEQDFLRPPSDGDDELGLLFLLSTGQLSFLVMTRAYTYEAEAIDPAGAEIPNELHANVRWTSSLEQKMKAQLLLQRQGPLTQILVHRYRALSTAEPNEAFAGHRARDPWIDTFLLALPQALVCQQVNIPFEYFLPVLNVLLPTPRALLPAAVPDLPDDE